MNSKLIFFTIVFLILIATNIFAQGLKITEIDVSVDYDEAYTYRLERRDRIDSTSVAVANSSKINADVLPGSNVTFTVRVENTFQGEEPDLRGVFTTVTIEEIDDGADLEEESLDWDLEPGDDYRFDVRFSIPIDVDAGTYNVIIDAEGEDRNETLHATELRLKLEVKKQSHDIRIIRASLSPSIVDCDRQTTLTAEIANAGSNAESEVALEFRSGNLGINSYDKDIFLESSDEAGVDEKTYSKTLNIEVPAFLRAGRYPIFVNLYWKNFVLFDQKTVELGVRDCAASDRARETREETSKENVSVIQTKEIGMKQTQGPITASVEASTSGYLLISAILLGIFVIIMISAIIAFAYFRNNKAE